MHGTATAPDTRSFRLLAALAILIAFAALAGLAATAVGDAGPVAPEIPEATSPQPARIGDKYGYVDGQGRVVIAPRFDVADTFNEGLALVRERGRFGYIDAEGAFAIPAVFRHALPFRNGFAAVRGEGEWIFLDRLGHAVAGAPDAPMPLAADAGNP